MNRSLKIAGFLLVTLFGGYGCTQAPSGTDPSTSPGAKLQRLEEDLKATLGGARSVQAQVHRRREPAVAAAKAARHRTGAAQGADERARHHRDAVRWIPQEPEGAARPGRERTRQPLGLDLTHDHRRGSGSDAEPGGGAELTKGDARGRVESAHQRRADGV